jgi:N-dimethylarginine dimethylaminohydrolase
MPKAIVMGDPRYFSVRGGANPHTRNLLGIKKRVDPEQARRQWHALARELIAHGSATYVIEPHPALSGLVYPANAGFRFPLDGARGTFYLANLLATRAAEREVYRPFMRAMGFETRDIAHRFEGEADFFPAGRFMLFTYGSIERQRFVARFGMPPWRRIYGFRSDRGAIDELQPIVGARPILALELALEAHYHGDTVLSSFGPRREFLLAYLPGLKESSRQLVQSEFGRDLIELSERDGALYAANSFQVDDRGKLYLLLPEGVSDALLSRIRERGVEPVLVNVSEFLAKGGGSIKCMILDLGEVSELASEPSAAAFRETRSYAKLFGPL